MAESLLAWFTLFSDSPKKLEARLKGRPVLLYEPPERPPSDDSDDDYQFRTQGGLVVQSIGGGEPLAVVIEKTKDNPFQRKVTIGRTGNNDIVLDDSSVSRFHAWIQVDEHTGDWFLCDAGSRNGSTVDGMKVSARTPTKLTSGVKIRIGAMELTFLSPQGFAELLEKRANE